MITNQQTDSTSHTSPPTAHALCILFVLICLFVIVVCY